MSYKCMNNLAPKYLIDNFTKRSDMHNCETRNNDPLNIPPLKTSRGQTTVQQRATKIWSDLDNKPKQITT